jgi:NAD(P)-dependent dehydrogenase (short-subunit alcohol dehydrogenase family)
VTERLDGRVALVTGGASGIGLATAVMLADLGADLLVLDRDAKGAERVASDAREGGVRATSLPVDLADVATMGTSVSAGIAAMGRIDILVNAAGILSSAGVVDLSEEEWDRVQAVNLKAPWVLIQIVARHMIAQGGGGRIVNVTSSSAFRAAVAFAAYAISKAGLTALTRMAAAELGRHDINVNAVAPGLTNTPLVEVVGPERLEALVKAGSIANLLGRLSEPKDVASVIVFLCLEASKQITGQTIHTSAGLVV